MQTNSARHVKGCRDHQEGAVEDVGGESEAGGGRDESRERTRGKATECPQCGKTLSFTNMAKH